MDTSKLLATVKDMPLGEVFAFAIEREQEAQMFYQTAQAAVSSQGAKVLLEELYQEEVDHEEMLVKARDGGQVDIVGRPRGFVDLGIAEMMPEIEVLPQATPQDILIRAMKKEAFAVEFYKAAARATDNVEAKTLFEHLAVEEREHKAKIETWYDDHILTDN
jgi:rubrerythrin